MHTDDGRVRFPEGFLWGAATAAHQVEGNNIYNDWWAWEQAGGGVEPSGSACRHYERYREDFDAARSLHHSAHRLSVEWSRIEPEEGRFDAAALQHYCDVIAALRERGIEPIVTLYHFTLPAWFAARGGWLCPGAKDFFVRFVEHVAGALCDKVTWWVTINEPNIYAFHAYVIGAWPPQVRSLDKARAVVSVLLDSHIAAYRALHAVYRSRNCIPPSVSIAQNIQVFEPCTGSILERLAVALRNRLFNLDILNKLVRARSLDYIGMNYYSRSLVRVRSWSQKSFLTGTCQGESTLPKNSLGWDIYPAGFFKAVMMLGRYKLPVMVLENGICTGDDMQRWVFIRQHLLELHRAMEKGVKVLGYIYWSLIDNYEWDKGFAPRFGLIDIDYATGTRTVRQSAQKFAEVCATGIVS